MKKILTISFLIILFINSKAQTYTPIHNAQAIDWLRGVKVLGFPTDTLTTAAKDSGAIAFKNGKPYYFNGFKWNAFATGTSVVPALNEVVGTGLGPTNGSSTFTDTRLIGLGTKLQISINGILIYNYGTYSSFTFNSGTGQIDISPNVWTTGNTLTIFLNQ